MFYFHKVAHVQYLGEVDIFSNMSKKFFLFTTVQKLEKSMDIFQSYDHKCTATFFVVHSVYNKQSPPLSLSLCVCVCVCVCV